MRQRLLIAGIVAYFLMGTASCRKHDAASAVRTTGQVGETLFDGKVRLTVDSIRKDTANPFAMLAGSRATTYAVQYSVINATGDPLLITHIETEFLASELVESGAEPFKHTYRETPDVISQVGGQDDGVPTTERAALEHLPFSIQQGVSRRGNESVLYRDGQMISAGKGLEDATGAWPLLSAVPTQIRAWGHFHSAQNQLSCRITLLNRTTVVAGPFTVFLGPVSRDDKTANEQSAAAPSVESRPGTREHQVP